jgi:hypothetical protein
MKMSFVARRSGQRPALHFGKALAFKPRPEAGLDPAPEQKQGAAVGVKLAVPPGHFCTFRAIRKSV